MSSTASALLQSRPTLGPSRPSGLADRVRLATVSRNARSIAGVICGVAWLLVAAREWSDPSLRAMVLIVSAVAAWALDLLPDYVVALGLVAAWNLTHAGPTAASVSGFVSPSWFMLVGILVLAAALARSGLLERLALRLLLVFPATFIGQAGALMLGGMVMTPLLPLTVGRSALMASLTVRVADSLGYERQSRPAVGVGLAAFVGAGLLARGFLSGATLNMVAASLLPAEARLGWGAWALAAAPVTLIVSAGSLAILFARFRPSGDQPVPQDAVRARLAALGPASRTQWMSGLVTLLVIAGFIVGPSLGVDCPWLVASGAVVLLASGALTRETFRSAVDWPLLVFLGVILSVPQMMHHAGVDTELARRIPALMSVAQGSPALGVIVVFAVTVAARFVLSEWVGVPLLVVTLIPSAGALGVHPWIVVLVILVASNLWLFPYQFLSYATFLGGAEDRLFAPKQARGFCLAYMGLALGALLAAIPLWYLLGLLR